MGEYCEDLPDEMLENIMLWLPPESLKRFKCVSRSWYALINSLMNSPEFVAKHLDNMECKRLSSQTAYCGNLGAIDYTTGKETYLLTLVDDNPESDHIPCLTEIAKSLVDGLFPKVVCHCNGIICLSNHDDVHKNIF